MTQRQDSRIGHDAGATRRELMYQPARKGIRVQGGFTPHTQAMRDLVTMDRISPFAAHLWQVLFDISNEPRNQHNGRWFPTQRTLCHLTGRSAETIIVALAQLEAAALLDRGTRSGSSGWIGATLHMPDYRPRYLAKVEPTGPADQPQYGTEPRDDPFFSATARSEKPISSDRENRSQTNSHPITPNMPNPKPLSPTTTPTKVVAVNPVTAEVAAEISQRRGSRVPRLPRGEKRGESIGTHVPLPVQQALVTQLLAVGVSQPGVQRALSGLVAHGLGTMEHLDRLIAYTAQEPNVTHPAGLLVSLCSTGFRPPLTPAAVRVDTPAAADQSMTTVWTQLWERVLARLGGMLDEEAVALWLASGRVLACDDREVVIGTPNVFVRDEIERCYLTALNQALISELGQPVEAVLVIQSRL